MMKVVFSLLAKSIYKDSYMLVWSILLPLGLFIGLGIYHESENYRANLLIGSMLLSVAMGAINTSGFWTMTQRKRGVFKLLKLSLLPVSRFILCSMMARLLVFAVIAALLLLSGALLFGMAFRVTGILILAGLLIVGTACFSSIGYVIASRAKDEGTMNMMSTVISFPMMFISTAFYSLEHAPRWIQWIGRLNPFEHAVIVGRNALVGIVDVQSMLVLLLFACIGAVIAVKTFRYE
jgi:ABC-2 type transport system permease protein